MPKLQKLRTKSATIANQARALMDEIKDDTTEARAAEIETEVDKMFADVDKINAQIERHEKLEAIEARNNAGDPRRPQGQNMTVDPNAAQTSGQQAALREVYAKWLCGHDLDAEERAVLRQSKSEVRAQVTGTGSAGGFTVPTELLNQIEISMKATGPMYDGSVVTEMVTASGNPLTLPTIDDTARTPVAHTEADVVTDDGSADVVFGKKDLGAYSFDSKWIRWSWELDMDSIFAMEQVIGGLLGEALGRIANTQLTTGNGTTSANGVVTASTLGKTAASATAITADEVIDLLHSVDPAYRSSPKAAFMCNDATVAALRKLKDSSGQYIWQMGDITKGVPATLLGQKVHVNQAMASIATAQKVMLFGDLGKYYTRKVGAPVLFVARERFAPDNGILGLIRFDGELANTAAVKHLIMA